MTAPSPAVWHALDLYRGLIRPQSALRPPLPEDMGIVIALACGEEDALGEQGLQTGEMPDLLRLAATSYLELLLTQSGNSDFAMLALNPGASAASINANKRALLKWLHPDRNRNAWQVALYSKVVNAAARLQKNEVAFFVGESNAGGPCAGRHRRSGRRRRRRAMAMPRTAGAALRKRGKTAFRVAALLTMLVALLVMGELHIMDPGLPLARLPNP